MVTHTPTHTYTHNYDNPRCAHAHRGLIMNRDSKNMHRANNFRSNTIVIKGGEWGVMLGSSNLHRIIRWMDDWK